MKKNYILQFFAFLFITFQTIGGFAQTANNTYSISNEDWSNYIDKTTKMLQEVDEASFLNYVVISSHGNINDMPYFKNYIKAKLKKDKDELTYRIGTGVITTVPQVKMYLASRQPAYTVCFADFAAKRAEIIESEKSVVESEKRNYSGVPPTPSNCGSPCTNPGFESGTGFWDYSSGLACTSPDPCSLTPGFSSAAHVLEAAGSFDPIVGAALPVVAPGGGSASLMIGDGPTIGGNASRASISFTVSASSTNFTYRYAVVLQDPGTGHTDPQRPYFKVTLRDASGAILSCGDYDVIAKPPIVGFILAPGTTDVYYRPWTTVFVPLAAYVGQCVTLEFTSSDCSLGGHYGYAYIDADCDPSTLLTSSPAVCGGATVTLTAPAGAAGYSWTNTADSSTTGIVGSATGQVVSVNQGGTYQVTMTSVTGATCISTLTITVPSNPANPVANYSNTTVCAGTPTAFTDISTPTDSITAWNWDFNNDGITDSTTQDPTYTFSSPGTYPVTLTIGWGPCNASFMQNITVLPSAIPNITSAGPVCSNAAPFNLNGGISGGTWSGTGITNTSTGTFDPSAASTTSTNVITYTTTGSCSGSDTIHIDVVPGGASPAWTPPTVCSSGGLVNLTSLITGTPGGTWSGSGVTGTTFNPVGLSGTYPVTYTVGTAPCVGTLTQNITVAPAPNITPVITMCSNAAPITLTVSIPGGVWGGPGITNTVTGTFDPSVALIGSTNFVTYTTSTGACAGTDTTSITVIASASPAWAPPTICSNSAPVNLTTLVTGTPGGTWTGPGVTGTTFDLTGLSGTIPITYTVGTAPCAATVTHNITITPVANATITAGATLCSNDAPITLTAANTGGTWSGSGINPTTGVFNPSGLTPGSYVVTYTISGPCGDMDTARVTVLPGGDPSWTPPPPMCASAPTVNLNTFVTGTPGGTWSGPGVFGNTFNPTGLSGNVTLIYTVGTGICQHSSTQVIDVDAINAAFTATPTSGMAPLLVNFNNGSSGAVSYFWSLGDGTTSIGINPSDTYDHLGDYTIVLVATNAEGCKDTASIKIHVDELSILTVPNIFTPNGDGENDVFHAILADGIASFKATVYDRWGLKMYEWEDQTGGWNGESKNGSAAPDGTYYYIINALGVDNKSYMYTGYIQLLREKQ